MLMHHLLCIFELQMAESSSFNYRLDDDDSSTFKCIAHVSLNLVWNSKECSTLSNNSLSGITQKRMASSPSLVPLQVSSQVISGSISFPLFIMDRNINLQIRISANQHCDHV